MHTPKNGKQYFSILRVMHKNWHTMYYYSTIRLILRCGVFAGNPTFSVFTGGIIAFTNRSGFRRGEWGH